MKKHLFEIIIHVFFWLLMLTSINIDWTADWFNTSLRPQSPAPLSLIVFALYFYVNVFLLLPRYFSLPTWYKYLLGGIVLFILPEVIRIIYYIWMNYNANVEEALFSRDSFLFGAPSPFFLGLNISILYRFTKDWFLNKRRIQELEHTVNKSQTTKPKPYSNISLLSKQEAEILQQNIETQIRTHELFLNSDLTLRELSDKTGFSEKKVSYFLNQNLNTNFYDYINKHRIEKFKAVVEDSSNSNLSIEGLAQNCGFSSKSSFYRAFKSQVNMSPSEYIKSRSSH